MKAKAAEYVTQAGMETFVNVLQKVLQEAHAAIAEQNERLSALEDRHRYSAADYGQLNKRLETMEREVADARRRFIGHKHLDDGTTMVSAWDL